MDGEFTLGRHTFRYEIVEITTIRGESYSTPTDIEDHLIEADQIFYSVDVPSGDTHYRWIGGPFEDFDTVQMAIEDETEEYEDIAA
jgi:hypothetical protein